MDVSQSTGRCQGLRPLVGPRLMIVSHGLERGYDRARGLVLRTVCTDGYVTIYEMIHTIRRKLEH